MGVENQHQFLRGTKGPFGMGVIDETGEDLLSWCQEQNLSWADSFYHIEDRGTWFHRRSARWYELDGFLVKNHQRKELIKKIETLKEDSFSDHRPKIITVKTTAPKYRNKGKQMARIRT